MATINITDHTITASQDAAQRERDLTIREALSKHRAGVFWAAFFCLPNIIIGYNPTIVGTLVGIPQFRKDFGYEYPAGSGTYVLPASWISAFTYAPVIGYMLSALWGGWCVDRYGPRKTLLGATALILFTLLLQVLGQSAPVIFVGDLLTGLLTGSFPVLGPAYISEILPVCLRGIGLACNNLAQVFGSLIAIVILQGTHSRQDRWAYKVPFLTEYGLPLIFIVGGFFAPETPWFLMKKGRREAATKSLHRTGYGNDVEDTLALIEETLEFEARSSRNVTYLDCFGGTNLRRTVVCAVAYSGQFLCGINLAASYCTYFFELAGLSTSRAFDMSIGLFALGVLGNLLSLPLMTRWGRRAAYIWTCCLTSALMYTLGFLGLASDSNQRAMYAKSVMLLLFNFIYNLGLGPVVYVLIAEIPNTQIRGKTLGVACFTPHIFSISITAGLPYAMSPTEGNWGAKTGFLFAGMGTIMALWAFFCLPETKGKTFEDLDILFANNVSARNFSKTDLNDLSGTDVIDGVASPHPCPEPSKKVDPDVV